MNLNLLKLRYFYEVARLGSISRGAQELRLSQPAVTKMVRELESELGTRLFDRRARGVTLTEAGTRTFSHASKIFAEVRELLHSVQKEEGISGKWAIGVSDTLAIHSIPSVIAQLHENHPALETEIFVGTSTEIKRELLLDRCDLGLFFTGLKRDEPLDAQKLFDVEFWVVVSPKLLSASSKNSTRNSATLETLRKLNLPRLESRHSEYRAGFAAHLHSQKLGFIGTPRIQVNQHEVKMQLAMEGAGFAILTRMTVESEVARGRLIRIPTPEKLISPVFGVNKKGRTWSPVIRAFFQEWKRQRQSGTKPHGNTR
ncbi:LysR family transcriptional regulator [Bdellovibrionota bacterium FG-1]